jgi:molybdopterin molybdotransferase
MREHPPDYASLHPGYYKRAMAVEPDIPQRIARLTPLDDVLRRIDTLVEPVTPRTSELGAALGATLAEDVVVDAAIPPAQRALRDGWAVASDLTMDAGAYAPAPLPSALRVDAGEPLPAGTDAVAPLDAVTDRRGVAQALAPVAPGEGVLAAGADIAPGTTLLTAGRHLDRLRIALLAAAGVSAVRIRAPRVHLVPSRGGDAVIDAAVGCIADAIESVGAIAITDATSDLSHALADDDDAVVVVGGTGSGRNDTTVRTLVSVGKLHAHGIALVPGETTAFGTVGARPVLALPGRLDAALAAWHMLGRAVLARLTGSCEPLCLRTARLTHKVTSTVGLAELVPVRCEGAAATPIASGYISFSGLAQADGWILIRPDSEGYPAQSEVVIRPWS